MLIEPWTLQPPHAMKRDEEGRKWLAGYMKTPTPAVPPAHGRPACPDHGDRMTRVLSRARICPACTGQAARPDPPAAK